MKSPAEMKVIQIDITNACPLRCSGCTRLCGHHEEPFFMDFETFKKAVDSLKGFEGIVGIMGGEPTIHPEFPRFMEYYRANVGYDDYSTASYQPTGDFMRHVLANAWHTDYSNKRGLWTMMPPKYYEHFELIQDTFAYQSLNDHSELSRHQTQLVTRKELGIPDDEWVKLRDACWVQNLWSASITPKGAFFCEVAAAMDATLGGPGGWAIEPGWWNRKPEDFKEQLEWCENCSACLPMPTRDARDQVDDVSPVWAKKLEAIKSPKMRKGLVQTFDPMAWQADKHSIIQTHMPYMDDQETRMGKTRDRLKPQRIAEVVWLTGKLGEEATRALLVKLKAAKKLAAVVGQDAALAAFAAEVRGAVRHRADGPRRSGRGHVRQGLGPDDQGRRCARCLPGADEDLRVQPRRRLSRRHAPPPLSVLQSARLVAEEGRRSVRHRGRLSEAQDRQGRSEQAGLRPLRFRHVPAPRPQAPRLVEAQAARSGGGTRLVRAPGRATR